MLISHRLLIWRLYGCKHVFHSFISTMIGKIYLIELYFQKQLYHQLFIYRTHFCYSLYCMRGRHWLCSHYTTRSIWMTSKPVKVTCAAFSVPKQANMNIAILHNYANTTPTNCRISQSCKHSLYQEQIVLTSLNFESGVKPVLLCDLQKSKTL